jgi:hypothetical protein
MSEKGRCSRGATGVIARAMTMLGSCTPQSIRNFVRMLAFAIALAAAWLTAFLPAGSAEKQTLEIVSKSGGHVFTVERARRGTGAQAWS